MVAGDYKKEAFTRWVSKKNYRHSFLQTTSELIGNNLIPMLQLHMRNLHDIPIALNSVEIPNNQCILIVVVERRKKSGIGRKLHIPNLRLHLNSKYLRHFL